MLPGWYSRFQCRLAQRRYLSICEDATMRGYLQSVCPALGADYRSLTYLAVDLETTGLDAEKDHILSVGFVPVEEQKVLLNAAQHHFVSTDKGVGQSAVIHGIHDRDLNAAGSLRAALEELLKALQGRVLMLHCADLDMAFLRRACIQLWGVPLIAAVVDTMALEHHRLHAYGKPANAESLRLSDSRRRYNLPDYSAHNALTDALSTAELFLAQMRYRFGGHVGSLRQILSTRYLS